MKILERLYLSLIRKPIKTFLLTALVFVVANILSSSLMLYDSTQLILEDIKNQIKPSIVLKTEYDSQSLNDYINVINNNQYNTQSIYKYKQLFKTIGQLEEIDYAGQTFISYLNTNENLFTGGVRNIIKPYEYSMIHNANKSILVITANRSNSLMFNNGNIEIVKGRNFTEDEINNGSNVIILHDDAKMMNEYGESISIEIGDIITINETILNSDYNPYDYSAYSSFDEDYYYGLNTEGEKKEYLDYFIKVSDQYNEDYINNSLYRKGYEFEVIGFYREKDYDEKPTYQKEDIGTSGWYEFYTIIPENTFFNIIDEKEQTIYVLFENEKHIEKNMGKIGILNNYYELKESKDIDYVRTEIKDLVKANELDTQLIFNNEIYLKIAGPLSAINSVSSLIFIVGIITSMTILVFVSIIFIKERRHEIGILLSIGENKKKVVSQILLEMVLVCMLGISCSMVTSKTISKSIGDIIMEGQSYKIELSEEEQLMVQDEYTEIKLMNKFDSLLESSNILSVTGVSLIIVLISTSISCLIILKMNPKEILM